MEIEFICLTSKLIITHFICVFTQLNKKWCAAFLKKRKAFYPKKYSPNIVRIDINRLISVNVCHTYFLKEIFLRAIHKLHLNII